MYIFRTYITLKDGTRVYAKQYGKKAFPIWIDDNLANDTNTQRI